MPTKAPVWKPRNAKLIAGNIKKVLSTGNIQYLNPAAYDFVIQYMGFIAHYDRYGFMAEYHDTQILAKRLLSGEVYIHDLKHNRNWASQRADDLFFARHTSPEYNMSVVDTINAVVDVAECFVQPATD